MLTCALCAEYCIWWQCVPLIPADKSFVVWKYLDDANAGILSTFYTNTVLVLQGMKFKF